MSIRVKTNNNTTTVRVGQSNAIKVVASGTAAASTVDNLTNVGDVTDTGRATNTFLMYNGSEYVHVPAHQVVDLADGSDDEAYDAGTF
jgi:DNA helicase TIP49 (TBP-interacting protein)